MAKKKTPKGQESLTATEVNKLFIDSMKKTAKALAKEPGEVTKAEFTANDVHEISDWNLRKSGGFTSVKKLFFSPPVDDPATKYGSRIVNSHRNRVEKWYGTERFMEDEILKRLEESLEKGLLRMHPPVKNAILKKNKKSKKKRTILAHLSDTHYGANIDSNEVGHVNHYDWKVAARRTALFVEQIVNYKPHYRDETKLIFCINGDILAGVIHDQEWFADLLTTQFMGALDILVQAISYLATQFGEVEVECSPGNHGRAMHKTSKSRASTHKWDSYETILYGAVKRVLEEKHSNVKVNIPKSPYVIIKAHGHTFFMTHGDTVINVGNPGKSLNIKDINEQINKLNASELGDRAKFAGILVGHVHTPTVQLTESGCMLIINGCLSGVDPFAQSIGIFESHPTQQLFEITDKHAVGDIRLIQVKDADDRKELDKIISPYKGEL